MIIVTGGAGFIGYNLVGALAARGERVVVCDWLGHEEKWQNLAKHELEQIVAPEDLGGFLAEYSEEVKAIFHMGAISTTTEKNVDLIIDSNFCLSRHLWEWCAESGIQLIYASSAATYGDGTTGFKDDESVETLAKLRPLNAYGWSKHLFDRWVARQKVLGHKTPKQSVGLKFFNVYGPNEYHKGSQRSVVDQVYPFAARNEPFPLFKSYNAKYPNGGQLRDFVWVGDLVNVMLWLYDNPKVNGLFNLGSGKARSFIDLATAVYKAAGKDPQIVFREMPEELRGKYQYFTEATMTKLVHAGYSSSFTSIEDGVKQYVQNYLATSDKYI